MVVLMAGVSQLDVFRPDAHGDGDVDVVCNGDRQCGDAEGLAPDRCCRFEPGCRCQRSVRTVRIVFQDEADFPGDAIQAELPDDQTGVILMHDYVAARKSDHWKIFCIEQGRAAQDAIQGCVTGACAV